MCFTGRGVFEVDGALCDAPHPPEFPSHLNLNSAPLDKTLSTPASLRGVQRRGQPALVPMTSASEWHRQDKTLSHSVYAGLAGWRAGVREKKLVHRRLHDAPIHFELLADAACHQTRSSFQARDLPFHPLSACECRYSMFTVSVKIEC